LLAGAAAGLLVAGPALAQGAGNGFLFGQPDAQFTIRAGYAHAMAGGDLFDETTSRFTLSKGDFSGPTFGAGVAFRIAPQLDLSLDVDYAGVKQGSEYRDFLDNDNLPIEQTTTFQRVPLTANLKMYLTPRGRSVGSLAFIPAKVVPWIGAGAGVEWYRFKQSGDFIDFNDNSVTPGEVSTSGWAPALQGMGGVDVSLTPRIALTGDARYTWSRATPGDDYEGYDKIDLSGVSVALGLTFRL
jgi:outer membrane protein W